jgi:hypothetical protein
MTGPAIACLYDTGAGPSCLSLRAFKIAQQAHAVKSRIENHGLHLTNASGAAMPLHGVFVIELVVAGHKLLCPMAVLKQMSATPFSA